ncbi:MAG TPA: hypothetical protein VM554_15775 [Acidisarcina sp.]|nr:hypothetical protein [Acidisarcina sp.]
MTLKKSRVALGLAVLVGLGSASLLLNLQHQPCEQRAPLTVMATLGAFVIAFCLRQFSGSLSSGSRNILLAALLLAAACVFADARFVLQYREVCNAPLPTTNTVP